MSKILKGLNEVNPNNYDSDWDYKDAVASSGRSRSSYRSQEDDTSDADIAYSKKMYQLGQKQKAAKEKAQRDNDHDRLASGTNEGMMPIGGNSTSTDRRKVMDLLQVYYKSMGGDFWEWFNQPGNKEFFAKRAEVSPDSAYEVVDSIDWGQHPQEEWPEDEEDMKEGSDNPWGDQGNFAGDKPVNLGGVSIKNIQTGDTVKYLGQPSKVVAMSKDRKYSRITISKGMGTVTQDVLTSDLQQLGQGVREEQLDELSNKKLGKYKTAAGDDASKADSEGDYKRGDKRMSGIIKATKKEFDNDKKKSSISQGMAEADEKPAEPFKTGYPRVNNPKILGTQNRAKSIYHPPSKPNVKKLDKPLPENLGNELKAKSLEALQQVKQQLEQQRMADLEQWEKDFKQNTVSKFTAREPNLRQRATSTSMVAMPGEKHSDLKARLGQLNKAIEKQGILDKLVQKLDKKGLLTPNIEAGVDTSMLARDGARDNYVELNKKLDKALEYVKTRLLTNKAAYAKPKAIDEEQLDELKCWSGYHRVAGTKAGFPGSCAKNKTNEQELDEIDRRGFLKGMGAAAVTGAAGGANALGYDNNKSHFPAGGMTSDSEEFSAMWDAMILYYYCQEGQIKNCNAYFSNLKSAFAKIKTLKGGLQRLNWLYQQIKSNDERLGVGSLVKNGDLEKFSANYQKIVKDLNSLVAFNESVQQGVAEGWAGALTGGALGLFGGPVGALFGAWIGHALQEKSREDKVKTQNLMDQGDVYQVYFDSKDTSGQLFSYIDAFDKMTDMAKKPHDIEKYFDIVDSRTGNSVFKYRAKADASNFLTKMAVDRRDELRQAHLNQTQGSDSVEKFDVKRINLDFNYFTPGFVNRVEGIAKSKNWDIIQAAGYLQELSNEFTNANYYPFGTQTDWQKLKTLVSNDYNTESLKTLGQTLKTEFKKSKDYFSTKKSVNQGVAESHHSESCPHCGGEMVSEELMNEKKDACYYKVKSRYKVWPSAYASGALVKCRNKGASNWGNSGKKNEGSILEGINRADESLHDWFNKEKWVRMDTKGKIKGPCAREPGEGKPKCLPQSKAHSLGKKGRASAAQRKRREDPNPERSGKAINVDTKKSKG